MRWIRYEHEGAVHHGRLEDDGQVTEMDGLPWGAHVPTGRHHALDAVRLLAPVVPTTFYAAGLNYTEHAQKHGTSVPAKPDIGYRANNALIDGFIEETGALVPKPNPAPAPTTAGSALPPAPPSPPAPGNPRRAEPARRPIS